MPKHEHQYSCITLREYRDRAEAFGLSSELDDRLDWFVSTHSTDRDADSVTRSNFRTAVRSLTEDNVPHEIVRFGHWLVGWVEHILVHPDHRAAIEALVCDDYPVLDDLDLSALEYDDMIEAWAAYGAKEMRRAIAETCGVPRTADYLADAEEQDLLHTLFVAAEGYWEHDWNGVSFETERAARKLDTDPRPIVDAFVLERARVRAERHGFTVYDGRHLNRSAYAVVSPMFYERTYMGEDLTAPGVVVCGTRRELWAVVRRLEGKGE